MNPLWIGAAAASGLGVALWLARRRTKPGRASGAQGPRAAVSGRAPSMPVGFGRKCMWLAVRGTDLQAVVEELALTDCRPASWSEGVAAGYDGTKSTVFVTPPLDGWVLVMGTQEPLPNPGLLARLSTRFGEAQHFATHRGASAGGWSRAIGGDVQRRVEFSDGVLDVAEGTLSEIEQRIGLRGGSQVENRAADDDSETSKEQVFLDEEEVLRVAGAWSLDPSTLDSRDEPVAPGTLGRLRQP